MSENDFYNVVVSQFAKDELITPEEYEKMAMGDHQKELFPLQKKDEEMNQ